jgi:hypothetical protein
LSEKCIAKVCGPLDIVGKTLYQIWQRCHCLDAWIPRLFLDLLSQFRLVFSQVWVLFQPLLKLNEL